MNTITQAMTDTNTTTNPGAASVKREAVIEGLGHEKNNAKRNKKGAAVVLAFDVLEDLLILRADGNDAELLARIDRYVADFKV